MADTDKTLQAQTRKQKGKIRARVAEELRQRIDGAKVLGEIDRDAELIHSLVNDLAANPQRYGGGANLRIAKLRLQAIEASIGVNFRKLAKVLPDLKAIELSDPEGDNPFASLASALKATVIANADQLTNE